MKNLVQFILKNIHWLLFFFLLFLSVFFLIRNNDFQRSKYLSVFHEIAGKVYIVSNSVESYMNLKTGNADMAKRIASLEQEVKIYQKKIEKLTDFLDSNEIGFNTDSLTIYRYITARVINNRVSGVENFITLNKGSLDGIEKDMGVLTTKGIVGVVMNVSPHFSVVITVLNSEYNPSCKTKGSNYSGPLVWDGKDSRYTYLKELPTHAAYNIGDTIVTSGYSTIFPAGIPVGIIENFSRQKNDDYNSLKVKLFTDFATLSEVLVVENKLKEEQKNIEKEVIKE
ncbi:MAG: rod shape-determining protein MreC [Candidatus Symbiothrix sp.]|nr:rod shape-determining protein MreC [Candidatus Symbiothrix sp.]